MIMCFYTLTMLYTIHKKNHQHRGCEILAFVNIIFHFSFRFPEQKTECERLGLSCMKKKKCTYEFVRLFI